METIDYLHKKNVYYGDMKPENLLVFRNYKIKLGDFGISIKLPDNIKATDSFVLKGLTRKFSSELVNQKWNSSELISRKDLIENDKYCLYKTFELAL
jgi:serine/threonine protein kinase